MHRLLALAAVAACTKQPSPCARQVEALRDWLAALAHDGPPAPVEHGLHLVALPDSPRTPAPQAPRLVMHPEELSFEGRVLAAGRWTDPAPLADALQGAARADLIVIADAGIPWSEIVTVAATAEHAGVHRLAFVFRFVPQARPPRSPIDRDVADLGSVALDHAALVDRVFDRCPSARALHRDDVHAFTDQLAPAIAACDCAVDLPAVQRLVWTAWQRDNPETVQTSRSIAIGDTGTRVALPAATPWDRAAPRLLTAAGAGAIHLTSGR